MKNRKQKLILLTGAHITPAVALTQEILFREPDAKVIYCGRKIFSSGKESVEEQEITRAGAEFIPLEFAKFNRFISVSLLTEFFKILPGLMRGFILVKRLKPKAVVSFGGYISIPVVVAAKLLGIPVIVHEQTLVWGLANRFSRLLATSSAVSWPSALKGNSVLTGNPIPKEIIAAKINTSKRDVLFISGGSQGSLAINRLIEPILPELTRHFIVYHQTGSPVNRKMANYFASRWFPTPEVAKILQRAKIVVSRSGANTVTYLAYLGIPSILIPLPVSGGGEQMANAGLLQQAGLAAVFPQNSLTSKKLLHEIFNINRNYAAMAGRAGPEAGRLIIPNAAEKLADLVFKVL